MIRGLFDLRSKAETQVKKLSTFYRQEKNSSNHVVLYTIFVPTSRKIFVPEGEKHTTVAKYRFDADTLLKGT